MDGTRAVRNPGGGSDVAFDLNDAVWGDNIEGESKEENNTDSETAFQYTWGSKAIADTHTSPHPPAAA